MEGEKPKPLRLAEVFADSRKVVLSDRGSMLVGNIVAEGNGPTLAVLDDGRCVTALADDREWFMVELSLRGEGWLANVWSEPLTEIERF